MRADEVPAGYRPIACVRCRTVLAFHPDTDRDTCRAVQLEHHLWLCTNPTPNAQRYRQRLRRLGP